MAKSKFPTTPWARIQLFFTFFDSRWEDLTAENRLTTIYRDFSAGLIVAMTAIPMAMGFAIAMGLRPENGIIAGALACVVGRICDFWHHSRISGHLWGWKVCQTGA